jgi:hypothetical protein
MGLDVVLFLLSTPKKNQTKRTRNGQFMLESSFQMIILKIDGIPPRKLTESGANVV